jgi:undecaprenyl-diphosphatase
MSTVTYGEATVVGLLQGVSELFPVSSLGHSVLMPALVGGRWARDLSMTGKDSPYLSVLVAMHVATALALVLFFWRDWLRLLGGLGTSLRHRRITTPEERLIWLVIAGSVPVGLFGLGADSIRTSLGKPTLAAVFLTLNGVLLFSVERLRNPGRYAPGRKAPLRRPAILASSEPSAATPAGRTRSERHRDPADGEPRGMAAGEPAAERTLVLSRRPAYAPQDAAGAVRAGSEDVAADNRLSRLSLREALIIGAGQVLGLLPGFSRSGGTIAAGLLRGLRHVDAARFAFLLATPAILGAGLLKIPELFKPANHAVRGPALLGSVVAGIAAYIAVRFLTSYFETRTLTPFAIYCALAGGGSLVYLLA